MSRLFLKLFLALMCSGVMAQGTVTIEEAGSWFFELTVDNQSGQRITSIGLEITGNNAAFDFIRPESVEQPVSVPAVGGNNDAIVATSVTWAVSVDSGSAFVLLGDLDSDRPATLAVPIIFADGSQQIIALIAVGTTWAGNIATTGPPELIIDGVATTTITWLPPTVREDESALPIEEIAGYVLYWDTQSGITRCPERPAMRLDNCYANALDLADGTLNSVPFTISLSGDTTLYFRMVAYSIFEDGSDGISRYSNEPTREFVLEVSIPPGSPPGSPIIQDVQMQVTCTTNQVGVTCEFTVQ